MCCYGVLEERLVGDEFKYKITAPASTQLRVYQSWQWTYAPLVSL